MYLLCDINTKQKVCGNKNFTNNESRWQNWWKASLSRRKFFWLYGDYDWITLYIRWIHRYELFIKGLGPGESGEGENNIHGRIVRLNAVTFTNETNHGWLNKLHLTTARWHWNLWWRQLHFQITIHLNHLYCNNDDKMIWLSQIIILMSKQWHLWRDGETGGERFWKLARNSSHTSSLSIGATGTELNLVLTPFTTPAQHWGWV